MMKKMSKRINDSGATLVLVIICMLFVGIIASVILSLTVGNVKTIGSSSESTENFYNTEDVVDSVKAYLQKFACTSATKAYAAVLEEIATDGAADEAGLETSYKQKFEEILRNELVLTGTTNKVDQSKFDIASLSFGKYASNGTYTGTDEALVGSAVDIDMTDSTVEIDSNGNVTLTNVKVKYADNNNNETTINTNFTFNAKLPKIEYKEPTESYKYDIDKFVIISNGKITTNSANYSTGETYGRIVGSLYANEGMQLGINKDNNLSVMAQYIITGEEKEIRTSSGLNSNSDAGGYINFATAPKMFLKIPYSNSEDEFEEPAPDQIATNGQIWAENIVIGDNGLVTEEGASSNPRAGRMTFSGNQVFFRDDITLDGKNVILKDNGGSKIFGYSSDSPDTNTTPLLTGHKKSSAIIVNAPNSAVDLSGVSSIDLAGTAYTEVLKNADINSPQYAYFAQGESLTFRSLQSVYLIPGDKMIYNDGTVDKSFGHNPLSATEYATFTSGSGSVDDSDFSGGLSDKKFTVVAVENKVTGGSVLYYYFFWDFSSTQSAMKYLGGDVNSLDASIISADARFKYYQDLLDEKMQMIGSGDKGYINLPGSDKIYSAGNLFKYPKNTHSIDLVRGTKSAGDFSSYSQYFTNINNNLAKTDNDSDPLFSKLLVNDTDEKLTGKPLLNTTVTKSLNSPSSWKDTDGYDHVGRSFGGSFGNGTNYNYSEPKEDATDEQKWNYKLITASDIVLSQSNIDANTKYIVVSSGNVSIAANTVFNGMIIAYGDVTIGNNVTLTSFGNFYGGIGTDKGWTSEFDALLAVTNQSGSVTTVNNSSSEEAIVKAIEDMDGNELLQRIFDVYGENFSMGDSVSANENLVSITTSDWKKN